MCDFSSPLLCYCKKRMKPPTFVMILVPVAMTLVLMAILIITSPKNKPVLQPQVGETIGVSLRQNASTAFIDLQALLLVRDTMTNLTNGCTPSTLDFINNQLVMGSYAQTQSGLTALRAHLMSGSPGVPQCEFYGMDMAEFRSGDVLGPADICYAYIFAGFQVLELFMDRQRPDINDDLIPLLQIAYPLTLFWRTEGAGAGDITGDVVFKLDSIIGLYLNGDYDIAKHAATFCNPYFSRDNLAYFDNTFLPWFAFFAEGTVTRISQNYIPHSLSTSLGSFDFVKNGETTRIKKVYTIGPSYSSQPSAQLFVDTALAGVEVVSLPDLDVGGTLLKIRDSLYNVEGNTQVLNETLIPVLVISHYSEHASEFDAFVVPPDAMFLVFTTDDTDLAINTSQAGIIHAGAASVSYMSVFDFITDYPYELVFGDVFLEAKDVADILLISMGAYVYAGTTGSLQLLDTFAIKNTVVGGFDVGGKMDRLAIISQAQLDGMFLGLDNVPFSFDLEETLGEDPLVGAAPVGLPATYNFESAFPACKTVPEDQNICNNCWARGSTDAISMRLCRLSGSPGARISHHHVTACSGLANGCAPQQPQTGFSAMVADIPTFACQPQSDTGSKDLGCFTKCISGQSFSQVHGIVAGTYKRLTSIDQIKTEIYTNGPVAVAMNIPTEVFTLYKKGNGNSDVYRPRVAVASAGGHMMTAVGWDTDSLIIKNSWGPKFSASGYWRIEIDNPVYTGKTYWPSTHGYTATPRLGSAYPKPTSSVVTSTNTPTATPKPQATVTNQEQTVDRVPTKPFGCRKVYLNKTHALEDAKVKGCPSTVEKTNSANIHRFSVTTQTQWLLMVTALALLIFT